MNENPFAVISPEELTAEQANQLFVEMHSDYPEIIRQGNTLITGARGCGKSMLIRCSMSDFLMVKERIKFSEMPYLPLNVPIKKTTVNLTELQAFENLHLPYLINEHFLTLHVVMNSFLCLSRIQFEEEKYDQTQYKTFFEKVYMRYMKLSGCKDEVSADFSSPANFFDSLYQHLLEMVYEFIPYIRKFINPDKEDFAYTLPLLSFSRFIVPVFTRMRELPGFPAGKPILIFIDDADNLSKIQTEILNSWLVNRTQPTISLKIFTQIGMYKSYLTNTGVLVESPHDYQEVNISSKYTTKFSSPDYYNKVIYILIKRLKLCGYAQWVDENKRSEVEKALRDFFPSYEKQEEGIKREAERIRAAHQERKRGFRQSDDVRRYAIPNYIRGLGGLSKSKNTYRYAGLENIIHLSSGIIRYLLDAAAKMYDVMSREAPRSKKDTAVVEFISTDVQNKVMRERADFYLFNELAKSHELSEGDADSKIMITDNPQSTTDKLANLINAMGKTFQEIMLSGDKDDPLSGRAERNVFSIALSNPEKTSKELKEVFKLGVRLGFLHQSYIGNKEGNGRTYLYILNRCFAPIFTLDPTGFQGYLFMTNEDMTKAIHSGKKLRAIDAGTQNDNNGIYQLELSDYWEE